MQALPTVVLIAALINSGTPSGTLSGRTVDHSGQGVASAVSLKPLNAPGAPLATRTSKSGHFHFVGLPSANYQLCVTAMGFMVKCVEPITISRRHETKMGTVVLDLGQCCGGLSIEKFRELSLPEIEHELPLISPIQ